MINGPESTNSNVTQQSSIINDPESRNQTKIDGPESNAIYHMSSASINVQSDQRFKMQILNKYSELFDGKIGLTKGEISITLKGYARPYQAPIRRVVKVMDKPLKMS